MGTTLVLFYVIYFVLFYVKYKVKTINFILYNIGYKPQSSNTIKTTVNPHTISPGNRIIKEREKNHKCLFHFDVKVYETVSNYFDSKVYFH